MEQGGSKSRKPLKRVMVMHLIVRGAPAALLVLNLTSCVDFAEFGGGDRYHEDFHYSYPLAPDGTVSLDNANGAVEITGWEQDKVEINGTRYGSTQATLDAVKIDTRASAGSVRIETVRPVNWHGNGGARYRIRVPRRVTLDAISTSNGSIQVEDVEGKLRLKSSNGSIRASRLKGDLEARTSNGGIEAMDVAGNVRLQTSNGSIKAEASQGSFEAGTTNGSIAVILSDATANWPVRLHSSNGHIEAEIKGDKIPDVRAETSNSSVTLRLPDHANARVRAHTSHSRITSDFAVATQGGTESKTNLEGTIGSGGPVLDLSSSNGSIKILKR